MFKLICIEGADKSGKTTLCEAIKKEILAIDYWHFTTCDKPQFALTDVPLQRNVNVFYQFYDFFEKHFYGPNSRLGKLQTAQYFEHERRLTYLLDRTLYSDIVYGPMYRGLFDELVVRKIERNFFTLMLQGLDTIFIYANNSDIAGSYAEIVKENEGLITSRGQYDNLRATYDKVMSEVKSLSDMTFLEYDFNKYQDSPEDWVKTVLMPVWRTKNYFIDDLLRRDELGQVMGNLNKNFKNTQVQQDLTVVKHNQRCITIQDYSNTIVKSGMEDLSKDSPLIDTTDFVFSRESGVYGL